MGRLYAGLEIGDASGANIRVGTGDISVPQQDGRRDGGQFIPHASTFLNARRYDDQIADTDLATDADGNPLIPGARYTAKGELIQRPMTLEDVKELVPRGLIPPLTQEDLDDDIRAGRAPQLTAEERAQLVADAIVLPA